MRGRLSQSQVWKITLIILLMSICIPLLMMKDTFDDFVPKQIAIIEETINNGMLMEVQDKVMQVPGFYIFGSQISLVCGIDPEQFIFLPIQLIPHAIIFFALIYRLTGNPLLSSLVTFIELASGTTGTVKIFFWPHGLGYLLFYSFLLIVLTILKQDRLSRTESSLFVLAIVLCSSLVYISYNLTAMALLVLAVILTLQFLFSRFPSFFGDQNGGWLSSKNKIYSLFIIMVIAVLGLSEFVYGVFIPTMQAAQYFQMSSLDKFLISFLSSESTTGPLSSLMVNYPETISLTSAIKYGLIILTILLFCFVFIRVLLRKRQLSYAQLFLFAILLMSGLYAIPRMMIGGIIISTLWFPGILILAHLYQTSKRFKVYAMVALSIILICTLFYFYAMDNAGYVNREEHQFTGYETPALWFEENNDGSTAVSDELTNNLFILYGYKYSFNNENSSVTINDVSRQHKVISQQDVPVLVQLSDGSLGTKYFIVNEKLTRMSIQNWIIIEAWDHSLQQINTNDQVSKICDVPQLSIYSSY